MERGFCQRAMIPNRPYRRCRRIGRSVCESIRSICGRQLRANCNSQDNSSIFALPSAPQRKARMMVVGCVPNLCEEFRRFVAVKLQHVERCG